ncbi:peptide/nickel transport system permease protein [Antricoccus suffuscus]|uniref:Peptide/nickel transport system permease protein n=1 Tax=Antricoccus suffuscus TaxID=1629062 RepID=A0A2T1A2L2_9ACTN|nr:ABC transporter permease [Antricoccus suffuscus]PRZ42823.1 peptide/nickel transport system permease protein [Antricoccus suffuscus]
MSSQLALDTTALSIRDPKVGKGKFARLRLGLAALWRRDAPTIIWGAIFVLILLVSAVGPLLLQSYSAIDPSARLAGPRSAHWLGTDEYGRDILARIVYAGRTSLGIGLAITGMALVLGTFIGTLTGFYDRLSGPIMRLMDGIMAFPAIVLAIALLIVLRSGVWGEIIALGTVFTPHIARVVRSRVLSLREKGYVAAARSAAVSGPRILLTHILPNSASTILVQTVFIYASALLADSSLSFLGLGVQPPTPTWGNMVGEARAFITIAPTFIVFPGIMIVLSVMSLNLLGEGIRGLIDTRARAILDLERSRKDRLSRARKAGRRG